MTPPQIVYQQGYRYRLPVDATAIISICPVATIETDYIRLTPDGELTAKRGYAWDGASGPAINTPNFVRPSLFHDVLYQLIRERLLPETMRDQADAILKALCLEDGMWRVRAAWVFWAVREHGKIGEGKPWLRTPTGDVNQTAE